LVVVSSIIVFTFAVGELGLRTYNSFFSMGSDEDPDAFHIYVLGGSSAAGSPFQPMSFGDLVSEMFADTLEGRPVVVHNLAACGETTYPQWVRLDRVVHSRDGEAPGAVLIYAGHNDIFGEHGQSDVPLMTRLERAVCERSVLAREASFGLRKLFNRSAATGMDSYGYYLRALVETALDAGLTPVLSTVAGNVSEIEPSYETEDREAVRRALDAASEAEDEGRCEASLEVLLETLPAGKGQEAFATYRYGRCLRRAGRHKEAREAFWDALDMDPHRSFGRATRGHNEMVRRIGAELGVPVVETVKRFVAASENGLPGWELFNDGQHPSLEGHLLLAEGFAEVLSELLGEPVRRRLNGREDVLARFPMKDPLSSAIHGGLWLLGVSLFHPWPEDRLRRAEACFQAVLVEDPSRFQAWMGLGLVQAIGVSSRFPTSEAISRIERWGCLGLNGFSVPEDDLDVLLEYLRDAGVEAAVLAGVEANHPARREPRQ